MMAILSTTERDTILNAMHALRGEGMPADDVLMLRLAAVAQTKVLD